MRSIQRAIFCWLVLFAVAQIRADEIELVESVPVQTDLDMVELRNTPEVWLEMINGAQRSLDIETFYFSARSGEPLDDILAAIRAAADRGVQVRIISEKKFHNTYPEPLNSLDKAEGIDVKIIDFGKIAGGVMHAKYFIVDEEQMFLGSQNFDWRSLKHIHELGIRIKNDKIVSTFLEVFNADWFLAENESANWNGFGSSAISTPLSLDPGDRTIPVVPVYSPRTFIPDSALWDEPKIISLMDSARSRICIQLLSYSTVSYGGEYYANLDNALRRAAARGVRVQMILSDWSKRKPGIDYLKSLTIVPNIEIRLSTIPAMEEHIPYARVDHCKYLLVDDQRFWIGTSNWSKSYFYNGRNIGLIVDDEIMANQVVRFFEKNWNSTYVYPLDPCREYEPPFIGGEE